MPIPTGNIIISRNPQVTAYEIAVANGFVGTEAQWLTSLQATLPYKIFSVKLNQTSTDDPTYTVIENTFDFTPSIERVSTGRYNINDDGLGDAKFTEELTVVQHYPIFGQTSVYLPPKLVSTSRDAAGRYIRISTYSDSGIFTFSDDVLSDYYVEIRLYTPVL